MHALFRPSFKGRRLLLTTFNGSWKMSFIFLFSLLLAASAFAAPSSVSQSQASATAGKRRVPSEDFGLQYQQNGQTVSAPLVSTQVSMSVAGLINRVTVQQTFTNPSNEWMGILCPSGAITASALRSRKSKP